MHMELQLVQEIILQSLLNNWYSYSGAVKQFCISRTPPQGKHCAHLKLHTGVTVAMLFVCVPITP